MASRLIPSAPASFDGELSDLYESVIQHVLAPVAEVEYQHHRLLDHIRDNDPLFIVRQVHPLEGGAIYLTRRLGRFKPSDNTPAWWMHYMAFNGTRDWQVEEMPTHIHHAGFAARISTAGWHVAHILNAKDRNTDWENWTREELTRRFIVNVHPCNCFYVPKCDWQRYGGDPGVIGFFAEVYAKRYAGVWGEFLALAAGTQPPLLPVPRYVYPLTSSTPEALEDASPVAAPQGTCASYRFSRLCFRADVIEALKDDEAFQVITPVGTFRMTKGEFYRDFPNVVASRSYAERGIYHYPTLPGKAEKYRVG